jgi:hypothetical protein
MVSHSLVVGYHGCDIRVARKVIALKDSLHPSHNPWDWLGHGFYFWEDSPARARRWAEDESKQHGSKIKHPAALGAVIDLGHSLNLADAEGFHGRWSGRILFWQRQAAMIARMQRDALEGSGTPWPAKIGVSGTVS